jgi:uncharacterized protein (DUF1330 family)
MSYYFIAQIKIKDNKEYQKYLDKAGDIFKKYKGEYLTIDNCRQVLEGNWEYTRMVVIKFNTEEDFPAWYHSNEYQEILKYRLNAAVCDTVLAKGLD